jgi:environmental stress-induced protein Ves
MRILRATQYRCMPWKNGGGETREIAVYPDGAPLDAFDWRISLATVASDGPFSRFEGITRTLTVLQGAGIRLSVGDEPVRVLSAASDPCTFDAGMPTSATLLDGPIVDLNVMTRRGRFRHRVTRQIISGEIELSAGANPTIVFCRDGDLTCDAVALAREDCAFIEGCVQFIATRPADVIVIEFATDVVPAPG